MNTVRFANNVSTELTQAALASDTTLHVAPLTAGTVWPALTEAGDYCMLVLQAEGSNTFEIIKCTEIVSPAVGSSNPDYTLTVIRGQEDTTPAAFETGTVVENRLTAGTLALLFQ